MMLPPEGVVVVWEWEWDDDDSDVDHVSESSVDEEANDHYNPDIQSESKYASDEDTSLTQTVTFKCIGTTHDATAQQVLSKAANLLDSGVNVPIKIIPEPDNQYDSKAIAFKCCIEGEWRRIGYIVREALEEVHSALRDQRISKISFAWVKYLVVWMRSGPGFYSGVSITIKGQLMVC